MNHRIFKFLICMAVVLSLASGGVCPIFAKHPPETFCKKTRTVHKGIGTAAAGKCHVLPCQAKDRHRLFLMGDASTGRSKTQDRQARQSLGTAFILETRLLFSHPQGGTAVLKAPSPLTPPPLFYIHCSLIC